jgi:hypothetical protein
VDLSEFWSTRILEGHLWTSRDFRKMPICYDIQCILCKIMLERFLYTRLIDMQPICTSMLVIFITKSGSYT